MINHKMDSAKIISAVQTELDQCLSFNDSTLNSASATSVDISTNLSYYLGRPNGTEVEGRSSVTSTDVADCIEWILPSVMDAFASSPDVIAFDPTSPGDEEQAELETQYAYDVIFKQNNGFVILHTVVKDALMQNNGVMRAYYTEDSSYSNETYTGLTEEQMMALVTSLASPQSALQAEIVNQVERIGLLGEPLYDIELRYTKVCHKINVEAVPLEQFRVNADHNSICLKGARFVCYTCTKTISDLRQEYPDLTDRQLEDLPRTNQVYTEQRFNSQGEQTYNSFDTSDPSMEQITVNECYMWIDLNGDGIAEYTKVTVAGDTTPSHILSVEPLPDGSPWIGLTGILMSHKFRGLSIYDRVKEIQDQTTAVLRSTLDNFYLQNNQEKEVVEAMVNMDDMLTSIPGGIKRVKKQGSITPLLVQPFTDAPIMLMRYLAELKAARTGVSADGPSAPQNIGDNVGSEGVEKLMTAKEALAGMIIRVLAETGLKELYIKVRDLAHCHVDTIQDYKFRDRWVQVNPSEWMPRTSTTVNVGVGSGNRQAKLMALTNLQQTVAQIAQSPFSYMISAQKVYNAVNDYCKFSGLHSAYKYLLDPASEEALMAKQAMEQSQQAQQQQQTEMTMAQLKMQADLAQAELGKAQAMQLNVQLKAEVEKAKQERELEKQRYDTKLALMESQVSQLQMLATSDYKDKELEFKEKQLDQNTFIELAKLNAAAAKPEKINGTASAESTDV
jgi:hypothetical protein